MLKSTFIDVNTITEALSFSLAPAILGNLAKKTKTEEERFEYTPCYDPTGVFLGFAVEKQKGPNITGKVNGDK